MFDRYQRSEQALVLALMEMVINGVSTRKVRRITEELCGTSFSKSTVSELCKALDPVVSAWNERTLADKRFPFVVVDAMQLKIRKERRVVPQSALIAVGVNEDGYREVLGLMIGDSESEATWSEFFRWMIDRGLHGVDLVVSDHHGGLVNAVKRHFQGIAWQRCQVHFMRNILDVCPKRHHDGLKAKLRLLFNAPDIQTARDLLDDIVTEYAQKAPRAVSCLEAGFDDAMAVMALPEPYRRRLRSTNGLERLNREVRRRERVIGIFPNVDSALRLLGAMLMEQDEEWSTGRLYFRMDLYWEYKQSESKGKTGDAELQRGAAA
jgi:transposase-like protein